MQQNHLLKSLVGFGIANDAHEGGQARASTNQVQALCGCEVINQQCACGFAAHHNGVAHLNVLQFGS